MLCAWHKAKLFLFAAYNHVFHCKEIMFSCGTTCTLKIKGITPRGNTSGSEADGELHETNNDRDETARAPSTKLHFKHSR